MVINVSTLVIFLIKFVAIVVLIWFMAVVTPKIAKSIENKKNKTLKNNEKGDKQENSQEDSIYKTDVFGSSYPEDVEKRKEKYKKK